jgi:hypothetical protein
MPRKVSFSKQLNITPKKSDEELCHFLSHGNDFNQAKIGSGNPAGD